MSSTFGRRRSVGQSLTVWHALATAAFTLTFNACATAPQRPFEAPRQSGSTTALHVVNRGLADIEVYQEDGATPLRLGWVPALGSTTLVLRGTGGHVHLLLRTRASGRAFRPEPVWVQEGQRVELVVQPMLHASELGVRRRGRL